MQQSRRRGGVTGVVRLTLVALAAVVAVGLMCGGLAAALPQAAQHDATIGAALGRLLAMALVAGLAVLVAAAVPRPAGAALLLAVTLTDLWTANGPLVRPLDPEPYYRNAAVGLAWQEAVAGRVWALDRSIPLRVGMLDRRTYDVQDYVPLTRADYWLFTHFGHTLAGVDTGMARAIIPSYNQRVAVLLGVALVIAGHPLRASGLVPVARVRVPNWGVLNGDWSHPSPHPGLAYAYRTVAPLPFALPVYATRVISRRAALRAVFAPAFDPRHVVLLDDQGLEDARGPRPWPSALLDVWHRAVAPPLSNLETHACLGGRMARGAGQGRRLARVFSPPAGPGVTCEWAWENGVRLRGTMRRPGVLLLDQLYDSGWTATVDGRPVLLRRADDVLTALPLPAGRHIIDLVYAPPTYLVGVTLTVLGYALLGAALLAHGAARLRPRQHAEPVPAAAC